MAGVIKNVRGGSVKWNEEDRLQLATLLIKAGYTVKIDYRTVPGEEEKPKPKKEYVVVFEEEKI